MFNKIKEFVSNLIPDKNKIETKPIEDVNNIHLCPARCQGVLMMHTETIRNIVTEMLEQKESKYSNEEMAVSIKFTGKNDKLYYQYDVGRGLPKFVPEGAYSYPIEYMIGDKYEITLTLAVNMKNRYKDGKDSAYTFCKAVSDKFIARADM